MVVSMMGIGVAPLVGSAGPASAAIPPAPPGCPFGLGASSYQGAAGSTFLNVTIVPASRFEHCTTTVPAVASLSADGAAYHNVSNNPAQQAVTLTFSPSLLDPQVAARFTLHCADPAGPGKLTLSVGGHSVTQAVPAQSCGPAGSPGSSLGVQDTTQPSQAGIAGTPTGAGYDVVDTAGAVAFKGNGGPATGGTVDPTGTAIAVTPTGQGYWVAGTDGSVYSYGSAVFHGSAFNYHLAAPIVGMVATPDGGGYWLVGADGGVFTFGDAGFFGSAGNVHLAAPVVGIARTADGHGYWLGAADGGVFNYGSAPFDGSAGAVPLNAAVTGIAADPTGGFWLAAADGGVFNYGGAGFHGSAGNAKLAAPVSAISATPDGGGYWLLGADGGIFNYGDAPFLGSFAS